MAKVRTAMRIGASVVAAAVLVALVVVYGASEWNLRRDRNVALTRVTADWSIAGIAEGKRLAHIEGCLGCHGEGHGKLLFDQPLIAVLTAPAFADSAKIASDDQLARSIRQGVSPTRQQLWVMPSHRYLADDDTARIIGYIRSFRASPSDLPYRRSFGPIGRLAILLGRIPESAHPPLLGGPRRWANTGEYFVRLSCLGCHNLHTARPALTHEPAPPLAEVAASYDRAAFVRLLRTGRGQSATNLGLMSEVSRESLRYLSDEEIGAIHAFLTTDAR